MRWENLNVNALDPHRLAAFWTAALGAEPVKHLLGLCATHRWSS